LLSALRFDGGRFRLHGVDGSSDPELQLYIAKREGAYGEGDAVTFRFPEAGSFDGSVIDLRGEQFESVDSHPIGLCGACELSFGVGGGDLGVRNNGVTGVCNCSA